MTEIKESVKKNILIYLYNYLPVKKIRFNPLKTPDTLEVLMKHPHYVAPSYKGDIGFMIFFKDEDEKYNSYIVSRYNLRNNNKDNDIENIKITPIKIRVTPKVYDGTIFEGTLIKKDNKNYYIICDVFRMNGIKCLNESMLNKLGVVNTFLDDNFNFDDSNLQLKVETMNTYNNLGKFIYEDIKNSEYNGFKIKGLIFYPKFSGIRIHYKQFNYIDNDYDDNIKITTKYKDSNDDNTVEATMIMKNSKTIDVYPIFLQGKNKLIKYGIAYIPNIKCSSFCRAIFKKNPDKEQTIICKYKNGKWIPDRKSDKNIADNEKDVIKMVNSLNKNKV